MHRPSEPRRPAATLRAAVLAAALLPLAAVESVELTGRVSVLGTAAWPAAGDVGSTDPDIGTPTADQQSLRLMLDDHGDNSEWSVHMKAARQHLRGLTAATRQSSDLFRYRSLSDDRLTGDAARRSTRLDWEIDRAAYKWRFGQTSLSVGRQPIDWGTGRFWQPLNVFGAFAPTDLDTDFKPGIDAAVANWYPSAFSSVTAVYALAPRDDPAIHDSAAIHYRRQVGETSEMVLLAGRLIGSNVIGASFESDWRGIGWRLEALHSKLDRTGENALSWIAGLDYQFDNGALVSVEWHDNGRGAVSDAGLADMQSDRLVAYGLQQQLSRRVLGLSVQQDVTPLLRASYTMLAGALRDASGHRTASLLHQLNLVYSVSNESDLLLSLSCGSGKALDEANRPGSEFGSVPTSVTARWRLYF